VPRGRFLGREVSTSERLASCSGPSPDKSRLLWTWCVPWSDRDGRLSGSPAVLRGLIVPMLGWSLEDVESAIVDLEGVGLVRRYTDDSGKLVLELWNFAGHQQGMKYQRETASKFGAGPEWSGVGPDNSGVVRPKSKPKGKSKPKPKDKNKGVCADPSVVAVWASYVAAWERHNAGKGGPTPTLSPERLRAITARLREGHSVADLSTIPARLFASAWHLGQNDRETAYLGAEHAFGKAERVERWLSKPAGRQSDGTGGLGRNYVQHGGAAGVAMMDEITRKAEAMKARRDGTDG